MPPNNKDEDKTPLKVRCKGSIENTLQPTCNHIWVAAYTPMRLEEFAKVLSHTHCPMCGAGPENITLNVD